MVGFSYKDGDYHNLGGWVETREDALKEAYYLRNWWRGCEEDAWTTMFNLCLEIDRPKGAIYVDRNYLRKKQSEIVASAADKHRDD